MRDSDFYARQGIETIAIRACDPRAKVEILQFCHGDFGAQARRLSLAGEILWSKSWSTPRGGLLTATRVGSGFDARRVWLRFSNPHGEPSPASMLFDACVPDAPLELEASARFELARAKFASEANAPDRLVEAVEIEDASKTRVQVTRVERSGARRELFTLDVSTLPHAVFVLCTGDFIGDTAIDLAIGMSCDAMSDPSYGCVRVFDGSTGTLAYEMRGRGPRDEFGRTLVALGDIDGDGKSDLLAHGEYASQGTVENGRVVALSAARNPILYEVVGAPYDDVRPYEFDRMSDQDGDAIDEFAWPAPARRVVRIVSGRNGSVIREVPYPPSIAEFESVRHVSTCLDLDGDGREEVVLSLVCDQGMKLTLSSAIVGSATNAVLHRFDFVP